MKRIITRAALVVAITSPAFADTFTYMCRVRDQKSYPVTVNVASGTLTWRGAVSRNLKQVSGDCRYTYRATRNGVTAELCTATQAVGDLTIGKASFECQMAR